MCCSFHAFYRQEFFFWVETKNHCFRLSDFILVMSGLFVIWFILNNCVLILPTFCTCWKHWYTVVYWYFQCFAAIFTLTHIYLFSASRELNEKLWKVWAGGQRSLQCGEVFIGTNLLHARPGERELTTTPLDLTRVRSVGAAIYFRIKRSGVNAVKCVSLWFLKICLWTARIPSTARCCAPFFGVVPMFSCCTLYCFAVHFILLFCIVFLCCALYSCVLCWALCSYGVFCICVFCTILLCVQYFILVLCTAVICCVLHSCVEHCVPVLSTVFLYCALSFHVVHHITMLLSVFLGCALSRTLHCVPLLCAVFVCCVQWSYAIRLLIVYCAHILFTISVLYWSFLWYASYVFIVVHCAHMLRTSVLCCVMYSFAVLCISVVVDQRFKSS